MDINAVKEIIETYEIELKKKDLLIKSMAKYIEEEDVTEIFCDGKEICDENCEKCVIEHFTKKVADINVGE